MVLISNLSKLDDLNFFVDIFSKILVGKKKCFILVEIYIKVNLQYYIGDILGFDENFEKSVKIVFKNAYRVEQNFLR